MPPAIIRRLQISHIFPFFTAFSSSIMHKNCNILCRNTVVETLNNDVYGLTPQGSLKWGSTFNNSFIWTIQIAQKTTCTKDYQRQEFWIIDLLKWDTGLRDKTWFTQSAYVAYHLKPFIACAQAISEGDVQFASSQCWGNCNNIGIFKKFLPVNNYSGTLGDNNNFFPPTCWYNIPYWIVFVLRGLCHQWFS